ncbi:MAG TPA: HAD hydrolase-like protein [Chitinophagaceae bacterium]|jgi:phosphoglycolate phosphatase|nr:HAD hydrolase-like protein [Chitinophagaceae bacterium]
MRKKIFFDLDGTLLDSKDRLYQLFQNLVPASTLSFDSYWDLKRNKIAHKQILQTQFSYTTEEVLVFERAWLERIELAEWLALDKPFVGVTEYLTELRKRHSLYLVTARQFKDVALKQLDQYGWGEVFEDVFVTSQKSEKYDLIKEGVETKSTDWLVGDTGKDIQTGKQLGVQTAAVLSGFLNAETLLPYNPDIIINSVLDLKVD